MSIKLIRQITYEFTSARALDKQMGRSQADGIRDVAYPEGGSGTIKIETLLDQRKPVDIRAGIAYAYRWHKLKQFSFAVLKLLGLSAVLYGLFTWALANASPLETITVRFIY